MTIFITSKFYICDNQKVALHSRFSVCDKPYLCDYDLKVILFSGRISDLPFSIVHIYNSFMLRPQFFAFVVVI